MVVVVVVVGVVVVVVVVVVAVVSYLVSNCSHHSNISTHPWYSGWSAMRGVPLNSTGGRLSRAVRYSADPRGTWEHPYEK